MADYDCTDEHERNRLEGWYETTHGTAVTDDAELLRAVLGLPNADATQNGRPWFAADLIYDDEYESVCVACGCHYDHEKWVSNPAWHGTVNTPEEPMGWWVPDPELHAAVCPVPIIEAIRRKHLGEV